MEIACAVWLDLGCRVAGRVSRVAGFGVPCGGAAGAVWPDVGVACVAVWLVDFGRWQQSGLTLLPGGGQYCHVAIDLGSCLSNGGRSLLPGGCHFGVMSAEWEWRANFSEVSFRSYICQWRKQF